MPQLEQSSLHPSTVLHHRLLLQTTCYRTPATTISVYSYTSSYPGKKKRSSNKLGTPLSRGVEKPEGPSALQPTTEIKSWYLMKVMSAVCRTLVTNIRRLLDITFYYHTVSVCDKYRCPAKYCTYYTIMTSLTDNFHYYKTQYNTKFRHKKH